MVSWVPWKPLSCLAFKCQQSDDKTIHFSLATSAGSLQTQTRNSYTNTLFRVRIVIYFTFQLHLFQFTLSQFILPIGFCFFSFQSKASILAYISHLKFYMQPQSSLLRVSIQLLSVYFCFTLCNFCYRFHCLPLCSIISLRSLQLNVNYLGHALSRSPSSFAVFLLPPSSIVQHLPPPSPP